MDWEVNIIAWIQSTLGDFSNVLGKVFSFIGGEVGLLILLVIVLFCWKKEVGQKLALVIAASTAWLSMVKDLVMRPRPFIEHPDSIKSLALPHADASATDVVAQGFSFPSIHSGVIVSTFFMLAREVKKRWFWVLAIALMLLMGFSRIASGNHYPTDVLVGWAMGFAIIGIFELLERFVQKEWVRHLILLAVTLPGIFFAQSNDYFTALGLFIGAVVAIPFERKFANSEDTRNVWAMVLRVLGAFAIYFVLNSLLKMPFSADFLASGTLIAFLVRTGRYAIILFVIMGVYPKLFPLFEKIGKPKQAK